MAAGTLDAQLATPQAFVETGEKRPFGPAGAFEMKMFLARSGVSFSIVRSALIGFWIHEPLPDASSRLLPVSSQERTSLVIVLV